MFFERDSNASLDCQPQSLLIHYEILTSMTFCYSAVSLEMMKSFLDLLFSKIKILFEIFR